jgi:hypothetical protein
LSIRDATKIGLSGLPELIGVELAPAAVFPDCAGDDRITRLEDCPVNEMNGPFDTRITGNDQISVDNPHLAFEHAAGGNIEPPLNNDECAFDDLTGGHRVITVLNRTRGRLQEIGQPSRGKPGWFVRPAW